MWADVGWIGEVVWTCRRTPSLHGMFGLYGSLFLAVGYLNKGYPHSTTKKDKPLRKPRQRLRPRGQNEPKPHAERLDHVLTRTRLARRNASTTGKSLTRTTLGRGGRPASPTNSQTKVKAFNATPTISYPHGYSDASMEAVPVSNPTFYCPSRDGR
jgi:hypothetical protein